MRWEDWDVLLFPAHSHVPLQEFRTLPFQANGHGLLTCFIPSQQNGSEFSVSVHSWIKRNTGHNFEVKVIIDGVCVAVQTLPAETNWPQTIVASTVFGGEGKAQAVVFPHFHRSTISQTQWNALEDLGRIKVELYVDHAAHVVFSFQHAPLDLLQRAGIAWPNPNISILNTPRTCNNVLREATDALEVAASTRGSSGYGFVPASSCTPLVPTLPYPHSYADAAAAKKQHQVQVRLPSDQFQMIMAAVSPPKQAQVMTALDQATNTSMPPPPLPAHATTQRLGAMDRQRLTSAPPLLGPQHLTLGPSLTYGERRGESRGSDVSMHACCTSFPSCISEDAEGRVFHSSPSGPNPIATGRKEGSSPSKPLTTRDFLSTVMGDQSAPATSSQASGPASTLLSSSPAADIQGRKRTRSALKSLTINDGSPEKKDKEKEKPQRKMSRRTSSASSDKENMSVDEVS